MEKIIKEIHHHYYHPIYTPQPQRYQGVWHCILPPPIVNTNWYYEPSYTTTTTIHTRSIERYDSI